MRIPAEQELWDHLIIHAGSDTSSERVDAIRRAYIELELLLLRKGILAVEDFGSIQLAVEAVAEELDIDLEPSFGKAVLVRNGLNHVKAKPPEPAVAKSVVASFQDCCIRLSESTDLPPLTEAEAEARKAQLKRGIGKRTLTSRATKAATFAVKYPIESVVEAQVLKVLSSGVDVRLPGRVHGWLPLSEVSHSPLLHPGERLHDGQVLRVAVLKHAVEGGQKVMVSLRRLEPDPWREVGTAYPRGTVASCTVRRVGQGGFVVDLPGGVAGWIPFGESAWAGAPRTVEETLFEGQETRARVTQVDLQRRRIELSVHAAFWQDRYPIGTALMAAVRGRTFAGLNLELEDGTGCDVLWGEVWWWTPEQIGEIDLPLEVSVEVVEHPYAGAWPQRLKGSIRRLSPDPWPSVCSSHPIGSVQRAMVTSQRTGELLVRLPGSVPGRVELYGSAAVAAGQRLDVRVLDYDEVRRLVVVGLEHPAPTVSSGPAIVTRPEAQRVHSPANRALLAGAIIWMLMTLGTAVLGFSDQKMMNAYGPIGITIMAIFASTMGCSLWGTIGFVVMLFVLPAGALRREK